MNLLLICLIRQTSLLLSYTFKPDLMKLFLTTLLICLAAPALYAQDLRLNDSVIFINNKPIALYAKELSNSPQRYNMEVYSFSDYVLIKAEVIKFNAPVAELKPFYYYELTFPPTADTFAIYIEEEAFPLVLAKIIRDYNLISKNELIPKNVSRFISHYYGGPALLAKIRSFEDHLNETRYFNEQVVRDRSKPVTIINDRVIMQDGVKIGLITENKNFTVTNRPAGIAVDKSSYGQTIVSVTDQVINTSTETVILLYNGRRVDNLRYYTAWSREDPKNKTAQSTIAAEKNLYQVSKAANKNIGNYTDQLLMRVCFLIEDYSL